MEAILEPLLKAGGVTGLVIGVFYLLYRQLLSMGIFAKLGSAQTFVIVMVVSFLDWSMAMSALFIGKAGLFAFVGGSSNTIQTFRVNDCGQVQKLGLSCF